jgi:hypothetical protein
MNLTAVALSTALFGGLTYFFYRKRLGAAAMNSVNAFTRWMRIRHGTFLALWILVSIYLYAVPDSTGPMLAFWWGCMILAIIMEAIQLGRTFSPRLMSLALEHEQTKESVS